MAVPDATATSLETLLRAMKERVAAAAEAGPRVPPALAEEADVKEMIFEEITVSEGVAVQKRPPKGDEEEGKKRRMLRMGAEGDDVRAMQVCAEPRFSSLAASCPLKLEEAPPPPPPQIRR